MALLKPSVLLLALASCYSPDIKDCKVSCTQAIDCAPSQVCGADGLCAHESMAGRCAMIASTDAGTDDAPKPKPPDAMPPDATLPTVKLVVRIDGRGDVAVPTVGDCDGGNGQMECTFYVTKDLPLTLQAMAKNNWRFDRWDGACQQAFTETCVITPSSDTETRVRFEMMGDGGDDD